MGVKYVETRVSVPDTTIPDYFATSIFESHSWKPLETGSGSKVVGRCNGFGRNLSVRTTYDVEIDSVAGNDVLQTLMRISPLGEYSV